MKNRILLIENTTEYFIIDRHAFFFHPSVFLQQFLAFPGQTASFLSIGMHDAGIQMLFGGFNFTPDRLVRHLHHFGGLIDGSGLFDVAQNFRPALTDDDVIIGVSGFYPEAGRTQVEAFLDQVLGKPHPVIV